MADKIGIAKITEDQDGELFHIVYVDGEKVAQEKGYFMSTSKPMRATEVREFFEKGGQPANEVEQMFHLARQNYRPA